MVGCESLSLTMKFIIDTFSISNFYEAIRHQFISFSLARLSVNVNLCYVYIMLCK